MAELNASLVKDLREKTGAGMMDCKKALTETSGNIEEAIDWLRKKGLSSASKKSERVTAEGLIGVASNNQNIAIVEINSETDFVSRNNTFQEFVSKIANISLKTNGTLEELKSTMYDENNTVETALASLIATIGENLTIRRVRIIPLNGGKPSSYVHNAIADGLGKIGVVINLSGEPKDPALGKQLAMHIAANMPKSLNKESLDQSLIEREKDIQRELAKQTGKSEEIIEKMLEGRIAKFYQEVCLLEQSFVMDTDKKVSKILEENGVKVTDYAYFILGEGIQKEHKDFAQEVAKVIG
jgi:elongation factor Ts